MKGDNWIKASRVTPNWVEEICKTSIFREATSGTAQKRPVIKWPAPGERGQQANLRGRL